MRNLSLFCLKILHKIADKNQCASGSYINVKAKWGPGSLIHPQYLYYQSKNVFARRYQKATPDSLQSLKRTPEGIVQNLNFSDWVVF